MGYSYYTREIDGLERHLGYGIQAECDHPGCHEIIDRGLGCLCGEDPGDGNEHGCGRYFCGKHLFLNNDGGDGYRCDRCRGKRRKTPWPMKPDIPTALDGMEWNTPEDKVWAEELSEKSRLVHA